MKCRIIVVMLFLLCSSSRNVIIIPDASTIVRGVMNLVSGQTFAGYKSFRDSLAVGVAEGTEANSTFQVAGSAATNLTKVTTIFTVANRRTE